MYLPEKNRKCEIELRFWKIDFESSVLKRVSIFRASFNIPSLISAQCGGSALLPHLLCSLVLLVHC